VKVRLKILGGLFLTMIRQLTVLFQAGVRLVVFVSRMQCVSRKILSNAIGFLFSPKKHKATDVS